jgi:hypothetical protein
MGDVIKGLWMTRPARIDPNLRTLPEPKTESKLLVVSRESLTRDRSLRGQFGSKQHRSAGAGENAVVLGLQSHQHAVVRFNMNITGADRPTSSASDRDNVF